MLRSKLQKIEKLLTLREELAQRSARAAKRLNKQIIKSEKLPVGALTMPESYWKVAKKAYKAVDDLQKLDKKLMREVPYHMTDLSKVRRALATKTNNNR